LIHVVHLKVVFRGVEPNYFFEDVLVDVEEFSSELIVDRDEMVAYGRANDPYPIHVDEAAAAASPFGGLIASGGFTMSLWLRLQHVNNRDLQRVEAFLGGFDWQGKFPTPVRAGDRLRLRKIVTGKRLSSKPGRGVVNWLMELINQDGRTVLSIEGAILMATRHQDHADPTTR